MRTAKPSFWSRPSAPILLGAGACAACCAVPIVAIVVGASAAGGIAVIFEPLAAVMLVGAVVLTTIIYARRRRARAAASCETTGACSIDQRCGCDPSSDDAARSSPSTSRAAATTFAGSLPRRS
jgi:hypothetical protein